MFYQRRWRIKAWQSTITQRANSEDLSRSISRQFADLNEGLLDPADVEICKHPDGTHWQLGQGRFGQVFKAICRGKDVAVKMVNSSSVKGEDLASRMEIAILQKVSHDPNIVQFIGACLLEPVLLVMEYLEGTLQAALWQERENGTCVFDWGNSGRDVALDVASGLAHLHSNGVIHRDVKSSNIMLTKERRAKVADVGVAVMSGHLPFFQAAGTFSYAAPELLIGYKCTCKVDTYSYGVLLWELVTKEVPQRGHMRDLLVPLECPSEVQQIVRDCMMPEMEDRPTMQEIVDILKRARLS